MDHLHDVGIDRLRWLILGLLCTSTALNYVDRQTLSVLLPTLQRELALTSAEYGTITSLFLLAYMVAQPLTGAFIDRVGTRVGFAIMVLFWSCASALHALARGPVSFALCRLLLGFSEAGTWPAGCRAVAQWFPQERRAFAMGVFDGGSAVGAMIAVPIIALFTLHFGWRWTFAATGLLGFLWLVLWLSFYRDPSEHPWLSARDRGRPGPGDSAAPGLVLPPPPSVKRIVRHRTFWGLLSARMLSTPVWWFYVFWLPEYLSHNRSFSLAQIGLYAWLPFLTVDIGKLIGGGFSDRLIARGGDPAWTRKCVMLAGAVIMTAGMKVVGAPSAAMAIAWICAATFGFGLWSSNILALHADIFPSGIMASVVGLTGTGASLGGALFTFAVGLVVTRAGYGPVFWAAGLSPLLAITAVLFVVRGLPQAEAA